MKILGKATALAFAATKSSPSLSLSQLTRKQLVTTTTTTTATATATATATSLQATKTNTQYLLRYEYIKDVLEQRGPYREEHLKLAKQFIAEGTCLRGGPVADVGNDIPCGALFLFTDAESAQAYAIKDPYVANGIVTSHTIEEWTVVVQKED